MELSFETQERIPDLSKGTPINEDTPVGSSSSCSHCALRDYSNPKTPPCSRDPRQRKGGGGGPVSAMTHTGD
ncbi:unnamed protein product [Boreogadus saida]